MYFITKRCPENSIFFIYKHMDMLYFRARMFLWSIDKDGLVTTALVFSRSRSRLTMFNIHTYCLLCKEKSFPYSKHNQSCKHIYINHKLKYLLWYFTEDFSPTYYCYTQEPLGRGFWYTFCSPPGTLTLGKKTSQMMIQQVPPYN